MGKKAQIIKELQRSVALKGDIIEVLDEQLAEAKERNKELKTQVKTLDFMLTVARNVNKEEWEKNSIKYPPIKQPCVFQSMDTRWGWS